MGTLNSTHSLTHSLPYTFGSCLYAIPETLTDVTRHRRADSQTDGVDRWIMVNTETTFAAAALTPICAQRSNFIIIFVAQRYQHSVTLSLTRSALVRAQRFA